MLESMSPEEAVQEYLQGRTDLAQQSKQTHAYRLRRFLEWCEEERLEDMNEVTGRKLHRFKIWRSDDVNNVTLRNQLGTIQRFMRWCESVDAAPQGVNEKLILPELGLNEDVNDTVLSTEEAERILEYLEKYRYGSLEHIIFSLIWHTGVRISTLRAFDVRDFYPEEMFLDAVNRPDTGTPLKNRRKGERGINLGEGVVDVLKDWVNTNHPKEEDEYGRLPLVGTPNGRAHTSTIRENLYRITRPCVYSNKCPHDRTLDECEGARSMSASQCPSSVSPHPVRKGSIIYHRNKGVPPKAVSDRSDVSVKVLEKHYDLASENEKRERRKRILDRVGMSEG